MKNNNESGRSFLRKKLILWHILRLARCDLTEILSRLGDRVVWFYSHKLTEQIMVSKFTKISLYKKQNNYILKRFMESIYFLKSNPKNYLQNFNLELWTTFDDKATALRMTTCRTEERIQNYSKYVFLKSLRSIGNISTQNKIVSKCLWNWNNRTILIWY